VREIPEPLDTEGMSAGMRKGGRGGSVGEASRGEACVGEVVRCGYAACVGEVVSRDASYPHLMPHSRI
jgi:hypothetical protein